MGGRDIKQKTQHLESIYDLLPVILQERKEGHRKSDLPIVTHHCVWDPGLPGPSSVLFSQTKLTSRTHKGI